ncbi:mycothiol transferase [Amycolatopsis sp. NPDC004368]
MITTDGYLYLVDRALDGMAATLTELGDELVNARPEAAGTNSPYAIVTHCLGVMTFWGGHVVAGREVERDRDAEFAATGPVAPLLARLRAVREQFGADVAGSVPDAAPAGEVPPKYRGTPIGADQGTALLHVYEELAQHRGHLELTRDVLLGRV